MKTLHTNGRLPAVPATKTAGNAASKAFKTMGILAMMAITKMTANTALAQAVAQDNAQPRLLMYSVFINVLPDRMNAPMIGFINYGSGSRATAQVGFINHNGGYLTGAQAGFLNSLGGTLSGAQVGFVNIAADTISKSVQAGFVNLAAGTARKSLQMGFVNIPAAAQKSVQLGFANVVGGKESDAQQIGFVNAVHQSRMQLGFFNGLRRLRGLQLGFINYADTIESGFPLGLVSIVRRGGYYALEVGISEMAAVMLSAKIGIKPFYSIIGGVYNPRFKPGYASMFGLGSMISVGKRLFLNPEFTQSISNDENIYWNLSLSASAAILGRLSISAGPSFAWQYGSRIDENLPFYTIYSRGIDARSRISIGAKVGLRVEI